MNMDIDALVKGMDTSPRKPASFHLSELEGHYWVHAQLLGNELHIDVGDSMVRMFNLSQLPDCIRSQLAMIHTKDWSELIRFPHYWLSFPQGYPENYLDIGWMLSDSVYVFVLSEKVLEELRGESPRG